jgi:phosphoserine phosphatase
MKVALAIICAFLQVSGQAFSGFDPSIAAAIGTALSRAGAGTNVVFDADGTLWTGDAGEAFFVWELENRKFAGDKNAIARRLWQDYQAKQFSERNMWIAAATLQTGLSESEVQRWAREFFHDNFRSRVFPAMRSAIADFHRRGARVWIVSASHRWIIEAAADYLSVPRSNVVAISSGVSRGIITDHVIEPVPFQQGKVGAIMARIGRKPSIVFSDSINDEPMLSLATELAVTINPDPELRRVAASRAWKIQSFAKPQ